MSVGYLARAWVVIGAALWFIGCAIVEALS
jgi:hypothetical protein